MEPKTTVVQNNKGNIITRILKNCYGNLSDFSSFHGFPEMYQATSIFWKIFWLLLLCSAFGLTGRLIYAAGDQFLNQGVTTVSETVKTEDIFYPPIKFCYQHWMYWVDFQKGFAMNFSKEAILFALSYMGNIYTSNPINITMAKSDFLETFAANNLSTLTEFYKSIAKYAPLGRFEKEYYSSKAMVKGKYFNEAELLNYKTIFGNVIILCYVQNNVSDVLGKKKESLTYPTKENILTFDFYDEKFAFENPQISDEEYNSYVAEWIQTGNQQYGTSDFRDISHNDSSYHWYLNFANLQHSYTSFSIPTMIFPDGFSSKGIELSTDVNECRITVKIAVRIRKSTVQNPCDENVRSVVSNVTCGLVGCSQRPQGKAGFTVLHTIGEDKPQNLYRWYIYYLNHSVEEQPEENSLKQSVNRTVVMLSSSTPDNATSSSTTGPTTRRKCFEICRSGCEQWNYEISFQSSSIFQSVKDVTYKRLTTIQIAYPLDDEVVKVTEVNLQTWESFVGSVGGLLGIWMGASVLSFCQFFYICICRKGIEFRLFPNSNTQVEHGLIKLTNRQASTR